MPTAILVVGILPKGCDRLHTIAGCYCETVSWDVVSEKSDSIAAYDIAFMVIDGMSFSVEIDAMRRLKDRFPQMPFVVIAQNSCEALAVAALKAGAVDYFSESVCKSDLRRCIHRLCKRPSMSDHRTPGRSPRSGMVATSPVMRPAMHYLSRVAASDSTVLITGETGTGKDLAAELIHRDSLRHRAPFVAVNCAALPDSLVESELFGHERGAFSGAVARQKGKFLLADKGTIFLDEIGEMSPLIQAKLLRAIEKRQVQALGAAHPATVDLRVIAATNKDPEQMVASGAFRKDLYYRLNVARLHLPPLRDRKDDIPELVKRRIHELNIKFQRRISGVSEEAMVSFHQYNWPGNIRELGNILESAFINCDSKRIDFVDLPKDYQQKTLHYIDDNGSGEYCRLLHVLQRTDGNKSEAAKQLQWSRMRVYRVLKRHRLNFTDI